jgi:glycosyltransferase involved in cell wall biosynthesis
MRILCLTQVLPYPLDAGPKTRAYYTLRYLSQQHEVTLLSFVRPGDTPMAVEHLRTFCQAVYTVPMPRSPARDAWHLLWSLANGTPFLIARDWVTEMANRVSQIANGESRIAYRKSQGIFDKSFDVVHADQLWMAPYALQARDPRSAIRDPRLVLDQHNAVFQIPRRLAQHETNPLKRALLALEGRKLASYEVEACRRFDHVVWVTEEDREAVNSKQCTVNSKQLLMAARMASREDESRAGAVGDRPERVFTGQLALSGRRSAISDQRSAMHDLVIPIGVDPEAQPVIERRPDAHRVTFLGGLHWPPNAEGVLWFAREVWPRVLQQVPNAVLTVIGKNPPKGLSRIADRRSRIAYRNSPFTIYHSPFTIHNAEVTGYVDDPLPYLQETAVFIVPLHAGGGMRVKILDAWCRGLPVVTTRVGAEGIWVCDGENGLLADTPEAFAQAVMRVLREPALAACLAAGGRRTVETHYDWRNVYRAWDAVYVGN